MLSFIGLCMLIIVGHVLRTKIRLFARLYLPSCVIGGLFGLLVIQAFRLAGGGADAGWLFRVNGFLTSMSEPWGKLPGMLINVVFACLFLGVALPSAGVIWKRAYTQLAYGQIVAWGQYIVGVGLWIVLIHQFWPELPAMFGGVLPVGFEGGHGTAGGLAPVFEQYDWSAGKDFALASATGGILSAIIVGMMLVNWATRKGYTVRKASPADIPEDESIGIIPLDRRPVAGRLSVHSDSVEALGLHLAIVGVAILIGYLMKEGLLAIEAAIPALASKGLFKGFPLFPLCMIGGLLVQLWEDKFDKHKIIDVGLTKRIQNTSLDFLVVAAIATIRVEVVAGALLPLLILIAAGIVWNVVCLVFLARYVFKSAWFERAIAELGQSMGVTATGLLLLRVVDPDYESEAVDAFASKQLLHEPFMGGGLWTGMTIPMLAIYGAWPVFGIACTAVLFWGLVIVFVIARRSRAA
jgi:ESS family glutamate:Na+ symporter